MVGWQGMFKVTMWLRDLPCRSVDGHMWRWKYFHIRQTDGIGKEVDADDTDITKPIWYAPNTHWICDCYSMPDSTVFRNPFMLFSLPLPLYRSKFFSFHLYFCPSRCVSLPLIFPCYSVALLSIVSFCTNYCVSYSLGIVLIYVYVFFCIFPSIDLAICSSRMNIDEAGRYSSLKSIDNLESL